MGLFANTADLNSCNPCALKCCGGPVYKNPNDTMPHTFYWHEMEQHGAVRITSVTHEIKNSDGTDLTITADVLAAVASSIVGGELQTVTTVSDGVVGTEYRLVVQATFSTCDGVTFTRSKCVFVAVKDC